VTDVRCSSCGGPLTATAGQSIVMPTVTITLGDAADTPGALGRVEQVADDAWCGPCLAEWDERMGLG
jgi:hypothetical protein